MNDGAIARDRFEEPSARGAPARIVLDSVVVATKRDAGWVKVRVRAADGELLESAASGLPTKEGRAAAAADALLGAIESVLARMSLRVELGRPIVSPAGTPDLVVVEGALFDGDRVIRISGSAFVDDDVASATARAVLDALNRHLEGGRG